MKRLIIDSSSVLKKCLWAAVNTASVKCVIFDDKEVKIPDADEGYEIFLGSLEKTLKLFKLTPHHVVLVKDGKRGKEFRRAYLPGYSVRPKSAPEFMQEFFKMQDRVEETLLKYGAISVVKDGFEADDLLHYIAETSDCITWSGDKDLLANKGDVYDGDMVNPDKFFGIDKKYIVVYKSLVGDTSDKIPGAKGFGEAAFIDMYAKYMDEGLQDILEMLEDGTLQDIEDHVEDFKPFQKIVGNLDTVYASYNCARFHHPGYDLDWKQVYPEGNGELTQWEPTQELITKKKLTPAFTKKLHKEILAAPEVGLDIETSTTEEGDAWMEANKNKQGKMPLDVLGSELAGFSLTVGTNCHKTYYFPVDHKVTDNITLGQAESLFNLLNEKKPTVVHNTSFELAVLRMHFELRFDRGYLPPLLYDTKIMSGYVDEYDFDNLKHNSKRYLGYRQTTYEEITTKTGATGEEYRVKMRELTGEEVMNYGCDDPICTVALYSQYRLIMDYEETWNCYEEVDVPVQFAYTERYLNGVKHDKDMLEKTHKENNKKFAEYYSEIQNFLMDLSWEEEIAVDSGEEPKKITCLADIAAFKNKKQEFTTVTHKWPGCEFVPAEKLTSSEVKRLYNVCTGEVLKTKARKFSKLAALIREEGHDIFAGIVEEESLVMLNNHVGGKFTPDPVLNFQSPKQLCSLMYDYLGLKVRIRGKLSDIMREKGQRQGNPAADKDAFAHAIVYDLQEDEETQAFIKLLLKAKSLKTEEGLYLKPYKNMPHYSDGMVHPQFAISAQKSGRGTAKTPNDSQVAKDGDIRKIYVPYSEDYVWVSLDLEAQELAHIAVHSQDKNMLSCFTGQRRDIHSIMGAAICRQKDPDMSYEKFAVQRKTDDKLTAVRNKKAKPTNFLKVYGGTKISLAIKLLCSEDEADKLLDIYEDQFPGVSVWQDELMELNKERGYAVTPMGRRRHIANVMDGSWKDDHEARASINHPIQGGSAEQLKLIVGVLWKEKIFEKFDAFFMGTVHDETNHIVHKSQVVDFIKAVHPIMCRSYGGLDINFRSSIEIGRSFGDLIEIGTEVDEEAMNKVLEGL